MMFCLTEHWVMLKWLFLKKTFSINKKTFSVSWTLICLIPDLQKIRIISIYNADNGSTSFPFLLLSEHQFYQSLVLHMTNLRERYLARFQTRQFVWEQNWLKCNNVQLPRTVCTIINGGHNSRQALSPCE